MVFPGCGGGKFLKLTVGLGLAGQCNDLSKLASISVPSQQGKSERIFDMYVNPMPAAPVGFVYVFLKAPINSARNHSVTVHV
jgi:hypothetical protein